jgi:hypothetical protein
LRNCGVLGYVKYYALLFGLGSFLHEIAGYLYVVAPAAWIPLDIRFVLGRRGIVRYALSQFALFLLVTWFFIEGGRYYIVCRILYGIYWGVTQNVAHYGLEIAESEASVIAARTYNVNPLLTFLCFGSVFRHLEHHAFPALPGPVLGQPAVLLALQNSSGIRSRPKNGFLAYVRDAMRQLYGPTARRSDPTEWRYDQVTNSPRPDIAAHGGADAGIVRHTTDIDN